MNDSRKNARRNWFRLSPAPGNGDIQSKKDPKVQTSEALQPIAHPENHDGLDLAKLPPMREAILNAKQVRQLFVDIGQHASDVLLMRRSSQSPRSNASSLSTPPDLTSAGDALLSGRVSRLQVRYRFQHGDWIDTLEVQESGFRLVRIVHHGLRS